MVEQGSEPWRQPGRLSFLSLPWRLAARRREQDIALVQRAGRLWRQMAEENTRSLQRNGLAGAHELAYPNNDETAYVLAVPSATEASTVGARITLMRERAGLSKRKLAALADVTEWQLRGWEDNTHEPTARNLMRLIEHIGGTVEFYLAGTDHR